jgi:ABC-type multidrug transport system fused ATPase/permease subunit
MFNIMFFTVGGDHAMSIRAVSFGGDKDKQEFNLETMTEAEINAAKLNIMIEDGGTNLSVGQRQLICIARAFISKPKILLMDEATANIDEKTDQAVQALIKSEFSDTTVITIAHRLNTIIQYDKILV